MNTIYNAPRPKGRGVHRTCHPEYFDLSQHRLRRGIPSENRGFHKSDFSTPAVSAGSRNDDVSIKKLNIKKISTNIKLLVFCLLLLFTVYYVPSINAQIMCSPNSLPRTCAGSQVCTINGNCGMLQSIICCITSSGFPTNTPIPLVTQIPIPTNLPTFPPPTSTPIPTPSTYAGSLTPWYTQNLSTSKELISKAVPDSTNTYLYLVGRSNIGENGGGWSDGSLGFVRKVKISDKSVIWTKTIGQYLGYSVGGIHDVKEDGSGLYISGYIEWGSKLYTAKLSPTDGSIAWEKTDAMSPSNIWSLNRGLGLDIDPNYVFIVGSDTQITNNVRTDRWSVIRKRKTDGVTEVSRVVDLSSGLDVAKDLVLSGAYVIVVGDKNGTWYFEKLNKSNLSLASSGTSIAGSVSTDSVVVDNTSIYVTGYQSTASGKGKILIEKRNISNLSLAWSYVETDRGKFQSNVHPLISGANLIVVGNNDFDAGLSVWKDVQVLYLSTSKGAVSKNVTYTGVGYSGGVSIDSSGQMYLASSMPDYTDGALFLVNEVNYTPTPTPTIPTVAGCNTISWTGQNNVTISGNSFTGTTYPGWNFENGANASVTAAKGTSIGGYTEIPQSNPNYGAMWGISASVAYTGWIDYSWYAPYYSGNDIYIMLPGRSAISMGVANPGDRFGVQLNNNNIAFTKSVAGSNTWQTMYVATDLTAEVINNTTQFRARVAGFSQIYRAYMGTSCQMVTIPSATPFPTSPLGTTVLPWYSTDISNFPEYGTQVVTDVVDEYVYLTGKGAIGAPFGWFQSGNGFVQRIRKSDKQVMWQKSVESGWGVFGSSGIYDVKVDDADVYISGYTWWGTRLYTAKLDATSGGVVWETEDKLGWSWFPYAGQSMDMDNDFLYIAKNSTEDDFKTDFSIVKKSKRDGSIVESRTVDLSNDWNVVTNVIVLNDFVYVSGYRAYTNPQWYIEKLNASDLSLVTSSTGVNGVVDMHGMITDGTYLYVGGFEKTAGSNIWSNDLRTRVHVEKRRLTDLGIVWTYNFPLLYYLQGSTTLALLNGEVLVAANDRMDRVGWFGSAWEGQYLRFIRLNQETGAMIVTNTISASAQNGVGNLGGMNISPSNDVFLAGSTTGRARTAIFRLNDLILTQSAFGLKVTQTVLNTPIVRGGPIQIRVDIENASNATQAAWAFSFADQIPNTILGVVWDCDVASTGLPIGDMVAFPARCGMINTGTGNSISFAHSSNADPLIHPGGKLSVTVSGVVAPNAPASIQNVASISSYPGWTQNHYYTVNFMSSPTNYTTLADNNPEDNTSTLSIAVTNSATTTPVVGSPTTTLAPSLTPTPTPTIPPIPSCMDQSQILRATIDGQDQYYCEDNDLTGHNLILVQDGVVEKLNSSATKVENVQFVHKPSINGQELVTVTFTLVVRNQQEAGGSAERSKEYSMTIRMR